MCKASPASYSSPSAAYPIPASCSQTLWLHSELLANTSSLDIHPGISVYRNTLCKGIIYMNHTLTSSGLNWASAYTNPIEIPVVRIVGKLSKIWANVVTPFSVGGGFRSSNGALGTKA